MSEIDHLIEAVFPPPMEGSEPAVWAVLDGARDDRIYRAVYDSRLAHECLFAGQLSYGLAEAAPYLVQLERGAPFTRWLLEEGWGDSFGIFAWSRADMEALRRHFRRILNARDERGKKLFFRYYDPRVLRVYLPTCTAEEVRAMFGPVGRFIAEGDAGEALSFTPSGRGLSVREIARP